MTVNAQLVHPNVVQVDSWGYDLFGAKHYFEMERVKGLSLSLLKLLELLEPTGPRQLQGQVDACTDVYSLGVALTAALSGQDVFLSIPGAPWEPMAAVLRGERQRVTTLAPDAALQALLESMMRLDREQRPRAHEVVDAFHAVAIEGGDDSDDIRQSFGARVREHYQEPRKPPRLRLIRGDRSVS